MQEGTRVLAVALSNDVFDKLDDYLDSNSQHYVNTLALLPTERSEVGSLESERSQCEIKRGRKWAEGTIKKTNSRSATVF